MNSTAYKIQALTIRIARLEPLEARALKAYHERREIFGEFLVMADAHASGCGPCDLCRIDVPRTRNAYLQARLRFKRLFSALSEARRQLAKLQG